MKKLLLIFLISVISCTKTDRINHYINQNLSEQELLDNGFYKYQRIVYEGIVDDHKDTDLSSEPTVASKFNQVTIDVFSNVRPRKVNGIPKGPINIFKDIPENDIKGKIVTYFFRNKKLFYKSIMTHPFNNDGKKELFKTKEDIKKYYNNLKINNEEAPLERLRNHNDSIGLRVKFIINNYESYFYLSDRNEMITYYLKEKIGNEDHLTWDFYDENSLYKFVE
ncbi:hypothetical protein [Flavobacterium foetidum]|uniref:hypothetical protein n=1 Tax=Flavobacterium foetidum TaxID=2026681 RepID=UPI0010752CCD|nr:hypothetical protein [Flavobacterium foetidum]KAF2517751.1 hypothetical protein E0W73_00675 [Flavobacterium foetidum]